MAEQGQDVIISKMIWKRAALILLAVCFALGFALFWVLRSHSSPSEVELLKAQNEREREILQNQNLDLLSQLELDQEIIDSLEIESQRIDTVIIEADEHFNTQIRAVDSIVSVDSLVWLITEGFSD